MITKEIDRPEIRFHVEHGLLSADAADRPGLGLDVLVVGD